MSTQASKNPINNLLKSNWSVIDQSRTAMAKEIASLANSISGPRSRQLKSVSRWLNSSQDYDAVLERPDVLCFCQPWVTATLGKANQESLTESEMAAAIGAGFCKFESNAPVPRDLNPFFYPLIALMVWAIIIVLGSIFLLPQFRTLFEEFGIGLPLSTQFIIEKGMWIEANWILLFAVILLGPLVLLAFLRFSQRNKAYSLNWFDRSFARFRTKLSFWASHFASLLSAGVDEKEAIQIAARCSTSSKLRARCNAYTQGKNTDLLNTYEYPLVSNSLLLKNKAAKIAILEESARYYQSVSRIVQSWWLAWLSKSILVSIVATIILVIISLAAPVFGIISGLPGGY